MRSVTLKKYFLAGLLILLLLPLETTRAVTPVLTQVKTQDKVISLTFDDGWDNKTCEQVRQILAEHEVVATIFPVGSWAAGNSHVVQRFLDDGHELGNHSMTHPKLTLLNLAQQEQELREAQAVLQRIGGERLTDFIRPPYGAYNQDTLRAAAKLGLRPITWSVDTWDWRDIPAEQVVERALSGARPGGVVLMHLAGRNTVKALPGIITGLKEQGYSFVKLSDLFAGQVVIAPGERGRKPITVTYQEVPLTLQPTAELIGGVAHVPCREFLEHFGWSVRWNGQQQVAICRSGDEQIMVSTAAESGITALTGRLENGKLYVPLRQLATELDLQISWSSQTNTVKLR